MANQNELKEQQENKGNSESNAERDQDLGNMNNGELGGDMGVIGNSSQDDQAYEKKGHDGGPATVAGDTGGGATDGSKAGSGLGPDGNVDNASSNHRGSAAEQ